MTALSSGALQPRLRLGSVEYGHDPLHHRRACLWLLAPAAGDSHTRGSDADLTSAPRDTIDGVSRLYELDLKGVRRT